MATFSDDAVDPFHDQVVDLLAFRECYFPQAIMCGAPSSSCPPGPYFKSDVIPLIFLLIGQLTPKVDRFPRQRAGWAGHYSPSVADDIVSGTGMSLEAAHQEIWTLFEGGYFTDTDGNLGIVPCHSHEERRIAAEQNKPLADYRRNVIKEEGLQDADEPVERRSAAS